MHPLIWKYNPSVAQIMEKVGALAAHPRPAMAAFERGASVLVYPGGGNDAFRPFHQWDKINFAERKGFIKLALKCGVPIVPKVSVGAHHGLYVIADLAPLLRELIHKDLPSPEIMPVYLGLPWGVSIGPLPNIPIPREIHIKICEPIYLVKNPKPGASYSRDFIEDCYHLVKNTMQMELDQLVAESPYAKKKTLPEMTLQ